MKKNLTLFVLIVLVLLLIIPLALYLHTRSKKEVLSQFNDHHLVVAQQITREIETHLRTYSSCLRILASLAPFQYHDRKSMQAIVEKNFDHLREMHIKRVSVYGEKGRIIYSTAETVGLEDASSEWFEWARKKENRGKVLVSSSAQIRDGNSGLRISVPPEGHKPIRYVQILLVMPLYQEAVDTRYPMPNKKFAGFLLMSVDLDEWLGKDLLRVSPKMKPYEVWLMDREGTLLFQSEHPEMRLRGISHRDEMCNPCHRTFDYAKKMIDEGQGTAEYQLLGHPKKLAVFAPMKFENTSWIVVVNAPYEKVMAFASRSLYTTLWLLGIVIFAVGGALILIYRDYRLKVILLHRALQLEETNKDLEAFGYSVSHDLRNPLIAISGFSRLLLEKYSSSLDSKGQAYLKMIGTKTQNMWQLIQDLLAFSRLGYQGMKTSDINIEEFARTVFDELKSISPERKLRLEIKNLPPAHGDPAMIRQVLTNLLSNAIKFTRPREIGVIEIGSGTREDQPIYYVKDNGIGFDMKFQDKLFGVFKRVHGDEEFDGTGVGLAMVQRIIHRHGGKVWAEGEINRGATFYFTLPSPK